MDRDSRGGKQAGPGRLQFRDDLRLLHVKNGGGMFIVLHNLSLVVLSLRFTETGRVSRFLNVPITRSMSSCERLRRAAFDFDLGR